MYILLPILVQSLVYLYFMILKTKLRWRWLVVKAKCFSSDGYKERLTMSVSFFLRFLRSGLGTCCSKKDKTHIQFQPLKLKSLNSLTLTTQKTDVNPSTWHLKVEESYSKYSFNRRIKKALGPLDIIQVPLPCVFSWAVRRQLWHYLGECAIHRFVLSHELIQEDLKSVDPNFDRRLAPVPLLLSHGLLQDVLKQSIEGFVADALTIVHLGKETLDHRKRKEFIWSILEIMIK